MHPWMTELTGGGGDHRVYTLTDGDSEWWVERGDGKSMWRYSHNWKCDSCSVEHLLINTIIMHVS